MGKHYRGEPVEIRIILTIRDTRSWKRNTEESLRGEDNSLRSAVCPLYSLITVAKISHP